MLDQITPVILTFNEEPNIGRVLDRLSWAKEVIVLDSGSTDRTLEIVASFSNTRCVHNQFESHAKQWNFALADTNIRTPWVLALDADYVVPGTLVDELTRAAPGDAIHGFWIAFRYLVDGVPIRHTLYPPLICLFRRDKARYIEHGHRMVLELEGNSLRCIARIDHDDRKDRIRWLASQHKYAHLEAKRLKSIPIREYRWQDILRGCLVLTWWAIPVYLLIFRGLVLDGRAGWKYAGERAEAEWLIALARIKLMFRDST